MSQKSSLDKYLKTLGIVEVAALAGSQVSKEIIKHSPETLDQLVLSGDYVGSTVGSALQHLATNRAKYFSDGKFNSELALRDLGKIIAANIPVCAATYSLVNAVNPTNFILEQTDNETLAVLGQWLETALIWHCLNFPVFSYLQKKSQLPSDPEIQQSIRELPMREFQQEYGCVPFQTYYGGRCWPPVLIRDPIAEERFDAFKKGTVTFIPSAFKRLIHYEREKVAMADFAVLFDQSGKPLMEIVRMGDKQDRLGYRGFPIEIGFHYIGAEPGYLVRGFREIGNLYHHEYQNPVRRICKKVPVLRELAS